MTSFTPIRDPKTDWLLTPKNAAVVIIDYQPTQIHSVNSINTSLLIRNVTLVAKAAVVYGLPVVLSTVNVATTRNQETVPPLREALADVPSYDRTSINAWEDAEFVAAVKATARNKLIMCALWTEACLAFPTLDALREGYEVYPVVDAIGGTTTLAHETALRRVEQAGAQLITLPQLVCELQRDWDRAETVQPFLDLMFAAGAFVGL
ncbi:MAG: isochorismatase family protein [Propionibacteriaceae bacterium]|jgi:nicotinamidase-related amidase|nr:isochorismatase family protein [Propionibacteriaceae bacterium]